MIANQPPTIVKSMEISSIAISAQGSLLVKGLYKVLWDESVNCKGNAKLRVIDEKTKRQYLVCFRDKNE